MCTLSLNMLQLKFTFLANYSSHQKNIFQGTSRSVNKLYKVSQTPLASPNFYNWTFSNECETDKFKNKVFFKCAGSISHAQTFFFEEVDKHGLRFSAIFFYNLNLAWEQNFRLNIPSSCMPCNKGTEYCLCDWKILSFHKSKNLAAIKKEIKILLGIIHQKHFLEHVHTKPHSLKI